MRTNFLLITALMMLSACSGGKKKEIDTSKKAGKTPVIESADDITAHPGHDVYTLHCLPCHQADGNGVPGMYPTLHDTEWVNGDTETLISIVLHGMDEEIEVNGEVFSMVMAPLPHLTDLEVADVLNYVRKRFGTADGSITPEQVGEVPDEG